MKTSLTQMFKLQLLSCDGNAFNGHALTVPS